MKAYDFENWPNKSNMPGLLFFAQCMEEMLFHFSHDSLKVPALNFHYICYEFNMILDLIQDNILDKGNIQPLYEEMKNMYESDPIAQKLYGSKFDKLFYEKNEHGFYEKSKIDNKAKEHIKKLRKTTSYLISDMMINDKYYNCLVEELNTYLKKTQLSIDENCYLYFLCRNILTELVNRSYSKEYIYQVVNNIFFTQQNEVVDIETTISDFWKHFDFTRHSFSVIFPIKKASDYKKLKNIKNAIVCENNDGLFGGSCNWIIKLTIKALEPEHARKQAIEIISFYTSMIQFHNHKIQTFYANCALIQDEESHKTIALNEPITLLKRGQNISEKNIYEQVNNMLNNYWGNSLDTMINVIELHSSAVESKNIDNQLLNLWTIIEVLIECEREQNFCRIIQICNILTSVLTSVYIKSLMKQLYLDILHCINRESLQDLFSEIDDFSKKEEKLLSLIILEKYNDKYTALISQLKYYPCLAHRITQYKEIFSNKVKTKTFLINHSKRLRWHIMRIYRSRNMIIHDGSDFPFTDIIVQNLHYYVDTLIFTINSYMNIGYSTFQEIYTTIQRKEYDIYEYLELSNNANDEQFISKVFDM